MINKTFLLHKDLIYFLVRTDIIKRYKQTLIGPLWAIIEPIMSMVIFTIIFDKTGTVSIEQLEIPYPIYLYAGMLPWIYLRTSLTKATNALISNRNLVQRVYFPRQILILTPLLSATFDFIMSSIVLLIIMLLFSTRIYFQILLVPIVMTGVAGLSFGLGLILSSINTRFRDISQVMPYLLQFWMFTSPVIYPPGFISGKYRFLFDFNPMTGYLEAMRAVILDTPWDPAHLTLSISVTIIMIIAGWVFFKKTESDFVDQI